MKTKKILSLAIPLLISTVCKADFKNEVKESKLQYFSKLSETFSFDFKKECEKYQKLENFDYLAWSQETHRAIFEIRDPDYLKELHCIIANRGRELLSEYSKQRVSSDDDIITFNIQSWSLVHYLHNAILLRTKELTQLAMSEWMKKKPNYKKFPIKSFKYVRISSSISQRIEKNYIKTDYAPRDTILKTLQAIPAWYNRTALNKILAEAKQRYEFDYNVEKMTQAMFRMAEREVMLTFIENIDSIYSQTYKRLAEESRINKPINLFRNNSAKLFKRTEFKITDKADQSDPNRQRILTELFTLSF